jgi:hypothetical protein
MNDRPSPEQVKERQSQNRYAREVISGNDVQLSHRASNAIPVSAPRSFQAPRSIPSPGSPAKTGYLAAILAILVTSLLIYLVLDFESASVALFILSLVLMAGWFVFSKPQAPTARS